MQIDPRQWAGRLTGCLAIVMLLGPAGCSTSGGGTGGNQTGGSDTNSNGNGSGDDAGDGSTGGGEPSGDAAVVDAVGLVLLAQGLTSPTALTGAGDGSGRLFVLDQVGQVRIIDGAGELLDAPFLDLSANMVTPMPDFDERGLLGIAFHGDYANNGRFFVYYTVPADAQSPEDFDSKSRISEFRVSDGGPHQADLGSERVILEIDQPQFNHNGGQLGFGPDGSLYIAVGDGGSANDVALGHTEGLGNGQDKSKLLGKLLRIDVDGAEPYAIPADNPFVGEANARPEIYAYGLRNPFRFSFDRGGEQRLFLGDVGQDLFEEIDIIVPGGNYGWNIREGVSCFDPNSPSQPPGNCGNSDADGQPLIDPIIEYPHVGDDGQVVGLSITGGYVYRGSAIPALAGDYVFGDFSRGFEIGDGSLFAATEDENSQWTMRELTVAGRDDGRLGAFLLSFGQDESGELYVLTTDNVGPTGATGSVFRIVSGE